MGTNLNRRQLMGAAVSITGTGGILVPGAGEAAAGRGKTPLLSPEEMAAVDRALGKKGNLVHDQGVYTVPLPRNDLKVTIRDEPVPIPFGFGGWVSFKKTRDGKSTVLMSDTVLLQEEVNPVISSAQENDVEITAIHNHFFYEEPRIFYMHVHAMGEPGELARAFAAAVRTSKLHPANQPSAEPPPARTGKDIFDLPRLDLVVGYQGVVNGPTYKYTVGRSDLTVMAMGAEITAAIGLNSWASFAGGMERAHVAGDIAMLEPEVNPVIAALRKNRLEVVALHHHMIGEEPRIIFLHYYGTGSAVDLAQGFREALNELGKHGRKVRMKGTVAGRHR
jgi:uncharacterized protein DUF1259